MAKRELVLGIDLGTTYFKIALFDRYGTMCGLARVKPAKNAGEGGFCELAVPDFWGYLQDGLTEAIAQAGADAGEIRSLSYSSQANSFLLMDDHDRPLTPLILWPDLRAVPVDSGIERLWHRNDFLPVTGLGVTGPEFCVAKLAWFQHQQSELWRRCASVRTISDYLVLSLTGEASGDEGTTSLLGLWDQQKHEWWKDGLDAVQLSPDHLVRPYPPGVIIGRTCAGAAALPGIHPGIPMAAGSLDHHAAAIGAGVRGADDLSASLGTVVACLRYSDRYLPAPAACMGPGTHGHPYYQLAFEGNGTGALDWFHGRFGGGLSLPELIRLAAGVAPGSDGLIALPSADRYPGFKGFRNLESRHQTGHIVRSLLESCAVSLRECITRLSHGRPPLRVFATGGGARSDLLLQISADLLDAEVDLPKCAEPACLGAGMLAAVAAGWFEDLAQVSSAWSAVDRRFEPDPATRKQYEDWYGAIRHRSL